MQSSVSFICVAEHSESYYARATMSTTKMRRKQSDDVDDDENNIFMFKMLRLPEHIYVNIFDSMTLCGLL